LTKDYAFSWSYGTLETFTLLIPNFMGGAQPQPLAEDSHTGKELKKAGYSGAELKDILEKRLPVYWGKESGAPTYFGAITCMLFVLGMFIIRNPIKWVFLVIAIFTILLSWGGNFEAFNILFFKYFPFYNKFRTPAMILSVANVAFVFVAGLAIYEILTSKVSGKEIKQALIRAVAITGGLVFIVGIAGSYVFNFVGPEDENYAKAFWLDALRLDRAAIMRMDALRSLVLIMLAGAAIWLYVQNTIKKPVLLAGLGVLVLFDTWQISKRYLNDSDFVPTAQVEKIYQPRAIDKEVLQDKAYYRILDVSRKLEGTDQPRIYNNAIPSYYHKSILGYHAAKIRRYQDLIEKQIGPNMNKMDFRTSMDGKPIVAGDIPVLNMLNMRYVIAAGNSGQLFKATNPNAIGNAWFVPQYRLVESPAAEMDSLTSFNPKAVAFIDKKFEGYLSGLPQLGGITGNIELTSYHPEKLTYKSNSTQEQLAAFSDIYYDKGWHAYIDGNPVDHIRVNYVLRAMRIPAGEHDITFEFHPKSYYTGEKVSLAFSSLLLLLVAGVIVWEVRKFIKGSKAEKPAPSVKKK
jgi:hypothetical protein